jgi:hypothetical protein
MKRGWIIGKDFGPLFLGHPWRRVTIADAIADASKLGRVEGRSGPYFLLRKRYRS